MKYVQAREQKPIHMLEEHEVVQEHEAAELRQEMLQMRQQIWKIKVQIEELKLTTVQRKMFVIDNAIVAAVFVGLLLGMVATMAWK